MKVHLELLWALIDDQALNDIFLCAAGFRCRTGFVARCPKRWLATVGGPRCRKSGRLWDGRFFRFAATAGLSLLARCVVLKALHPGVRPVGAGAARACQLAACVGHTGGGQAGGIYDAGDLSGAFVVLNLAFEAARGVDRGDEAALLVPRVTHGVRVGGVCFEAVCEEAVCLRK